MTSRNSWRDRNAAKRRLSPVVPHIDNLMRGTNEISRLHMGVLAHFTLR